MPHLFEVVDPQGRRITCSQEAWDHILAGHSDLEECAEEIRRAIEKPWMGIYQDMEFADRQVYYTVRTQRKRQLLKVVVRRQGEKNGEIVTAYPALNPKAGEKLI
jgi:hypothetical protein